MSFTKWIAIGSAFVVLGALGGGIGMASRQLGPEPAGKEVHFRPPQSPSNPSRDARKGKTGVLDVQVGSQSPANPARKALKEAEEGIVEYEKQLKTIQTELVKLVAENALLKARVQTLESQVKADPVQGPISKRRVPGDDTPVAADVTEGTSPDVITTKGRVVVSRAAKGDRVIIYLPDTGNARSYRPAHGAKVLSARVWQQYVLITSNGPGGAQLAAYDYSLDQWATQDLRQGIKDYSLNSTLKDLPATLVAPIFQGSPLTQVAILDLKHFRWSVFDLIEPWDKGPANPWVHESLAAYVLGRNIYAYSAAAGRWDALTLEKAFNPEVAWRGLQFNDYSIAVSEAGRLHIFAVKTGRWQTIDPKD